MIEKSFILSMYLFGSIFVLINSLLHSNEFTWVFFLLFFFYWETNHAIDHALSKHNSFHLLYLDLLIHQSHQEYTAVHRFRERIGVGDL